MRGFGPRNGSVWVAVSVVLVLLAFAARPSRGAEPSLAIGGYDPVAYFTQGRATKGDPNYEYVWDDTRYRFVSAQDRDLFTARPEQYAPQFPGYCAMSLANGVNVEPNPEYWLIKDGKLYLFGKSIGPSKFSANFGENVVRANENWRRGRNGETPAAADQAQ
ncbi:MAG: YHS domain-containing (seleno)protein [Stellaceae bacterium]